MPSRLKADVSLVLCTVIWGSTFVVVKGALAHSSVFVFMGLRFTLAALLMALIFRRDLRRITRGDLVAGGWMGFLIFSGYVFQNFGLLATTPSKAGFITGFSVVLVPVFLAMFWRRRINAWAWCGAAAATIGLYYLSVPAEGITQLGRGDALVFCCAVVFALHIAVVGHYSPRHSVGALSFLQIAATAALTLVALPILTLARWEPPRLEWTGGLIAAVLITAVLATAVSFSVQVWAQQHTAATHTAIIFTLEPVFAAITSYIVIHERLSGRSLFGAGLILGGILLSGLKGPTQAAPESPGPVSEEPA